MKVLEELYCFETMPPNGYFTDDVVRGIEEDLEFIETFSEEDEEEEDEMNGFEFMEARKFRIWNLVCRGGDIEYTDQFEVGGHYTWQEMDEILFDLMPVLMIKPDLLLPTRSFKFITEKIVSLTEQIQYGPDIIPYNFIKMYWCFFDSENKNYSD